MASSLSICNNNIRFIFYFRFIWNYFFYKKKITNTVVQVRESEDSTYNKDLKIALLMQSKLQFLLLLILIPLLKLDIIQIHSLRIPSLSVFGDQFDYQQEKLVVLAQGHYKQRWLCYYKLSCY